MNYDVEDINNALESIPSRGGQTLGGLGEYSYRVCVNEDIETLKDIISSLAQEISRLKEKINELSARTF